MWVYAHKQHHPVDPAKDIRAMVCAGDGEEHWPGRGEQWLSVGCTSVMWMASAPCGSQGFAIFGCTISCEIVHSMTMWEKCYLGSLWRFSPLLWILMIWDTERICMENHILPTAITSIFYSFHGLISNGQTL